jgi:LCP family protein required for cell wall assembly
MRKKTKKKSKWRWGLYGLLAVLAGVIGYAAYQGFGVYNALDNFNKSPEESRFGQFEQVNKEEPPKWEGKERVNILLLGADARGLEKDQVARTDTMLLASIDPVTKKAHLFSILRDTYVDIEGHGKNRINAAITLGGPKLTMSTIGDLLGLDIQYYVYTDFEGFKALVDAIGGVDYEVEKDMKWTDNADGNRYDIDLKKGYQHLDGDKALQYVRFRHDAMSDFTRTERQRNFLKAVAQKMQSSWNLLRMKQILESVTPYIETNLTPQDMLKLGMLGLEVKMSGSAQVPPMELLRSSNGGAAVLEISDEDKLREYVQEQLATDESATVSGEADGTDSGRESGGGTALDSGSSGQSSEAAAP